MEKKQKQMSKKECKGFEMDLTDYVMGETTFLTPEKQEALFEHLRQCAKCRDELRNWKHVQAVMKTKSAMDKPEHQEKINKLIQRLHQETLPPPQNSVQIVGTAAGQIYRCLKDNGPVMSITLLRKKTKLTGYPFLQSIGWLERENKIITRGLGDPEYAELCREDSEAL